MAGFIPDITTRVTVNVHSENIENAKTRLESDPFLSQCSSIGEWINEKEQQLKSLEQPVANAIGERLKSNQEMIIAAKHVNTGMMAGSVEITQDGSDVLVGNTATSVDGFPYPLAIETGRREVYPVDKSVLRWFEGGQPVFAKRSGAVAADPFVEPSINTTMGEVEGIVHNYIEGIK